MAVILLQMVGVLCMYLLLVSDTLTNYPHSADPNNGFCS